MPMYLNACGARGVAPSAGISVPVRGEWCSTGEGVGLCGCRRRGWPCVDAGEGGGPVGVGGRVGLSVSAEAGGFHV